MAWTACPVAGTQMVEGIEKEGGLVRFTWTWEQDTATQQQFPYCDGPVRSAQIVNNSASVYYASLPQTRSGPRQVQINPGYSRTVTQRGQLAGLGLDTRSDCVGVIVSSRRDPALTLVVAT